MAGLQSKISLIYINATPTAIIYIAGDYNMAEEALRQHCSEEGDCWAVEHCNFIYTGGQEAGVKMTRIDYPRFPMTPEKLQERVEKLAEAMLFSLHQRSCTVVGPLRSTYMSRDSER